MALTILTEILPKILVRKYTSGICFGTFIPTNFSNVRSFIPLSCLSYPGHVGYDGNLRNAFAWVLCKVKGSRTAVAVVPVAELHLHILGNSSMPWDKCCTEWDLYDQLFTAKQFATSLMQQRVLQWDLVTRCPRCPFPNEKRAGGGQKVKWYSVIVVWRILERKKNPLLKLN